MLRFVVLALLVGCNARQPLTPSYFHAQTQQNYASCQDTVSCYASCNPFTEQCMQSCDARTSPNGVAAARALTQCTSNSGCRDETCTHERCGSEVAACTNEREPVIPPPPGA